MRPVSEAAYQVLQQAEIDGNTVRLTCGQLDRAVYEEVDAVLKRLGGKWKGGRTRRHIFPWPPAMMVQRYLDTGELPPKNPRAFFPTPDPVIDLLFQMGDIPDDIVSNARILEPSAGAGALARRVRAAMEAWCDRLDEPHHFSIDTVEIDPWHAQRLKDQGFSTWQGDFLDYNPGPIYSLVVMNPPFSRPGSRDLYIKHIRHAYSLLKPHGKLVAIAPVGFTFRSDAANRDFLTFVNRNGFWEHVGAKAFRDSGTDIDTIMISMTKEDQSWRKEPYNGWASWDTFMLELLITREDYDKTPALVERIRSGELGCDLFGAPLDETVAAIRSFYEPIVERSHQEGVSLLLDDEEWRYMAEHFLECYVAPEERAGATYRAAA
jgi:hypothetical protein